MKQLKSLSDWGFTGDPEDDYQVYIFIRDAKLNGHLFNKNVFKKLFPVIYSKIESSDFDDTWSFSQVLYHYFLKFIHVEFPVGTCATCGGQTKFRSFKQGYCPYCSSKCSNSNENKKQKCIETCIDRYGVSNASMDDDVKQKIENTFIEKYGETRPSKTPISELLSR